MADCGPHDETAADDAAEADPGQYEMFGADRAPEGWPVVAAEAAPGTRSGAVVTPAGLTINPEGATRITGLGRADHGTVAVNGDGTITYRPDDGFSGHDAFVYEFEDAEGEVLRATVRLEVAAEAEEPAPAEAEEPESAPVEAEEPVPAEEDAPESAPAEGDAPEAVVTAMTDGAHGTVRMDDRGALIYRPEPGFVGTDRFTYTLRDAAGYQEVHTVVVRVDAEGQATLWVERTRGTEEDLGTAAE